MGNTKNLALGVIGVILTVVIVFFVVGGLSPNITDAQISLTEVHNCTAGNESYLYNTSDKGCWDITMEAGNSSRVYTAGLTVLPLVGTISTVGILILMVGLLITIIAVIIKRSKQ